MSYSGYPSYTFCYEAPQNDSTSQNGYVPARSNVPTSSYPDSAAYSAETPQTQYPSHGYPWPSSSQQAYGANGTTTGQYTEDPYRDSTNGQTSDYQREHASHIGSNGRQAEIQVYSNNTSHAQKQASTQALNELAFASGLESSGIRTAAPAHNVQGPQRIDTSQNNGLSQGRTEYSAMNLQHTYGGQAQPSPYHTQSTYPSNELNQLATSAAAALKNLPKSPRVKPASPVISIIRATPTASQQRPQSPYVSSEGTVSHQRHQSSQSRSNQRVFSTSRKTTAHTSKSVTDSTQLRQTYNVTPAYNREALPQQNNSIADLSTGDKPQESPSYHSATDKPNSSTFVAPFEILNPYHKEQDKARREAAAKMKAAEDALRTKNVPPRLVETQNQPDYSIAVSLSKISKPKSKDAEEPKALYSDLAGDLDPEAEARQLLERLKVVWTKDPAAFQKVWDEHSQKASATTAARALSAHPMPPQRELTPSTQLVTPKNTPKNNNKTKPAQQAPQPDMPRGFNGYKVVVKDNENGCPDIGKFPAERRIRYSYVTKNSRASPAITMQPSIPPAPAPLANSTPLAGALVFNPHAISESVSLSRPLPQQDKDGKTGWPEASHKALVGSAIRFLESDSRNESLTISDTDFFKILKSNPSYIDLCLLIEARGFNFDRRQLAKVLMNSVPGLGTQKQVPVTATASPNQIAKGHSPAAPPTFNLPAANNGPLFTNGNSTPLVKPETSFKRIAAATPLMKQRSSFLAPHARAGVGRSSPQLPAPVPGSKEDNARKRDFKDLIDLTNDDDEDYIVPEKRQRVRSPSPDPKASFVQQSQPLLNSTGFFTRFGGLATPGVLPSNAAPLKFDIHAPGSSSEQHKQTRPAKAMLAKRLNKAEALRRNYYDPKTVARDILVTIGKHPDMIALNSHMAHLLGSHIELESDLSTFNWEDVDPGGPPASKTPWTDIPAGPPRFKARKPEQSNSADARSKSLQSMAVSAAPLLLPTRDFTNDLASIEHVTINKYTGRFGSGNFQRATVYVGLPPKKQKGSMPSPLNSNQRRDSSPQAAHRAADSLRSLAQQTKSLFNDSLKPSERRPSGLRHSEEITCEVNGPNSQALTAPKKRRPGRPTRDSNVIASSYAQSTEPQRRNPGRPRRNFNVSPAPSTEPQRRGPGRPPQSASSPQVRISFQQPTLADLSSPQSELANTNKMDGKRKGRSYGARSESPPIERKSGMTLEVVVPRRRTEDEAPEYPVFKCRWIKCSAELHNISTLRKHIAKLHKPEQKFINDYGYVCYWKKCNLLHEDDDGKMEATAIYTEEEWLDHINEEHIHPLGQKYGDGPSTQHIGKQVYQPFETVVSKYFYNPSLYPTDARTVSYIDPQAVASDRASYLADSQGRVTTYLAHSDDEPDAVILNNLHPDDGEKRESAQKAFNSFLTTHGHSKQDMRAAAEETLKALSVRKEKIGVGIDRGGCTLINDEMRKTFAHNPGISRIVDYDY